MTKSEVTKILTYLMADFDQEITEAKRDVWFDQFRLVDYETAFEAARLLLKRKSFGVPRISDFEEAVRDLNRATGIVLDEGQAFDLAMKAVAKFGYPSEASAIAWIAKQNQVAADAVSEYGFRLLCTGETRDLNIARAQFGRLYRDISQRNQATASIRNNTSQRVLDVVSKLTKELPNA